MTDYVEMPRETREYMGVTVRVNGAPVTTPVEVALAVTGARPTVWAPASVTPDGPAVLIADQLPGLYDVYARTTLPDGQVPVVECGAVLIT
jgi:hypothetical protein